MQYAQRRSPSSNAIGIGLVVVLHLGVGYALLQALHTLPGALPMTPLIVHPVEAPKKPEVELPKLQEVPTTQLKPVYIPLQDFPIQSRTDVKPLTGTTTEVPKETNVGPVTPVVAPLADTRAGARHIAGPSLAYPRRPFVAGEEGWVEVQCDVDDMGGTSNCAMTDHKGSLAFVDATMDYVKAARYSPATHNGVAVAERGHRFHIDFKLSDK